MVKQISFIHAADLHIDSPFKGFTHMPAEIREDVRTSTFTALDQLVRTAIAKEVDFVLLVGDVFDHAIHSLKAQVSVRKACEHLHEHNIDVFMSFGNHDYLKGAPFQLTFPPNVHVFQSEEVTYFPYAINNETAAHIYGFSYENQAVTDNKVVEYYKKNRDVPFHIAMLHGSIDQQSEHEPYAPFRISDVRQKNFDYWALGHVHQRAVLQEHPPIIYSGNTQGRHRKETGEKGCYYVTLTEGRATTEFIPLHSIEFNQLELDIGTCMSIEQVEAQINEQMEPFASSRTPTLVHLLCTNATQAMIDLEQQGYLDELLDVLNDQYIKWPTWAFVYDCVIDKAHLSIEKVYIEDHFLTELHDTWEDASIEPMLESLYEHRRARKFLEHLTEEEKQIIKQDAFNLLMQTLVHKRGTD